MVREYAGKAHELDLRQALLPLAEAFRVWERAEIDSFELQTLIHRFHQDDARAIYLRYVDLSEPALAGAIAAGVLARDTLPPELLDHLSGLISYFEKASE